ncbi:MAG: baseplate J/gp47 family protein [Anaerolineales bacterium]|nr:baseplate J/gp47 family protein [Anaerolineales bacterium]
MKTQIIHLDPHDDIASAQDKISWSKAGRIVLVWPGRNRILTDMLDLRLLQRQAVRRNAQIGLVSLDPDVQSHARKLRIPVFEDLDAVHESKFPENIPDAKSVPFSRDHDRDLRSLQTGRAPRSTKPLPRAARITLFSLPVLALVLTVFTLLPTAKIQIDPARQEHEQDMIIPATGGAGRIGSSTLRRDQIRIEGSLRIATSGITSEPGEFAHGVAEFTNLTDEAVSIPSGTTVRVPGSEGLYFSTQANFSLPAEEGSTGTVGIVASLPGASGNVSADRITAVDGSLGLLVSVKNPEATSGGSIISRSAVAPSDLVKAREMLSQQLLAQAEDLIIANRLPQERLLDSSIKIQEVISQEYDHDVNDTADTLNLAMSVIAEADLVDSDILVEAVQNRLSLGTNNPIVPGSLVIKSIQLSPTDSDPEPDLHCAVVFETYQPIDRAALANDLRGLRVDAADRHISSRFPGFDFRIELNPDWYPWMPFLTGQILVSYSWEQPG